jgi:hypothetical protein
MFGIDTGALVRISNGIASREVTMKRSGLVVLTLTALGLGAADARTAAAQPVG